MFVGKLGHGKKYLPCAHMWFVLCTAGDLGKDQKHCGGSCNQIETSHQKKVPIVKIMIIPLIKKAISCIYLVNLYQTGMIQVSTAGIEVRVGRRIY